MVAIDTTEPPQGNIPPPPIAICGMSMRLPGGIENADEFWDLLVNKKDARSPIPKERFNVDTFYSAHGKNGYINTAHGYFLENIDLAQMDAGFFNMSAAEIERVDPQQRLLLEVVYEAFESAGETGWKGKNIGCYVGTFGEDWYDLHARDSQDFGMYRITGSGDFVLANRVSYEYDLKGPSMTIKVGCSSAMVSLHLACEALYSGSCSAAIVGGTNLLLTPVMTIAMCEQGALSPDGSCKTFDASANGYARADAINVIYIKRLDDAIRDGNPIRAIIRSTASNCDGKTPGLSNPSTEAHESLIRKAYNIAGLEFADTAMVECHGTGTPVGDPIEVNAVANVWRGSGVLIGSVKPNVGHSEGASGLTSIIKSVLSLENKTVVPNIKFTNPNPKIPFEEAGLSVPTEPMTWPLDRAERISVNSFGIGGANAHAILDSAESFLAQRTVVNSGIKQLHAIEEVDSSGFVEIDQPSGTDEDDELNVTIEGHEPNVSEKLDEPNVPEDANGPNWTDGIHEESETTAQIYQSNDIVEQTGSEEADEANGMIPANPTNSTLESNEENESNGTAGFDEFRPSLLVFSANHPDSLVKAVANIEEYYTRHQPSLTDLAHTLGARRDHMTFRSFTVADAVSDWQISLGQRSEDSRSPVFVFTGQGAQWAEMGKELMENYPSFLQDIKDMDEVLQKLEQPPDWSIQDEILKPAMVSSVEMAEFSQPLCTALQVALVNLLRRWGVSPAAVIGHSSGEIAGAYAARSLTLSEAITVAYYRGLVTKEQTRLGGMAAVGLGRSEVVHFLQSGLRIACENSGQSVTVSGDEEPLETFISAVEEARPDVFIRRLRVEMAYHSDHMEAIGQPYQDLLEAKISPQEPCISFYSSVKGTVLSQAEDFGPSYWRENLESPVLFYSAALELLKGPFQNHPHLEIGPHSALAGPLKQIYKENAIKTHYVSALRRGENSASCLLRAVGQLYSLGVKINFSAMNPGGCVLQNLPHYPWKRDVSYWHETRVMKAWRHREFPHHDILGSRIVEASDLEPTWRNILHLDNVPWIRDHMVQTDIVYPAAAYVAMTGAAAHQLTGMNDYTVRNVTISSALVLQPSTSTEIITTLRPSRLTTTLDSEWYDFTIVSHSKSGWTKHCIGQVRGGPGSRYPIEEVPVLPRKVLANRWYKAMSEAGLNYGPRFVGMSNITTGVDNNTCSTTIIDKTKESESCYQLHPVTIDLILQSIGAAVWKGQPRTLNLLHLPASIGELYIGAGKDQMIQLNMKADIGTWMGVTAAGYGLNPEGQLAFCLKGAKLSPFEGDNSENDPNPHAAVQVVWKPDADMLDTGSLMQRESDISQTLVLSEKLSLLCAIESCINLEGTEPTLPHLQKYHYWLQGYVEQARQGCISLVPDSADLLALSSSERCSLIESLVSVCDKPPAAAVAEAIHRVFQSSRDILEGKTDALELLFKDDVMTGFYKLSDVWGFQGMMEILGHENPTLRILEIGAGTGSITESILKHLKLAVGERMYSTYTYTDISAACFAAAQARLKDYAGITYATLDISKDPVDQGFDEYGYDLIIASNVLHATPKLSDTLAHVRKLLHPRGRLLLQELSCEYRFLNYVMGVLPGWWLGEEDNRHDMPYVSVERWDNELRSAGFEGVESAHMDHELPYQLNVNILARPAKTTKLSEKRVTLLTRPNPGLYARQVGEYLTERGFSVDFCTLGQSPPPQQDIISILDLDGPFFHEISEGNLQVFIQFVSGLKDCGLLWLTRSAQMHAQTPRYAMVIGLARTIRSELGIAFATLEIDRIERRAWEACLQVFEKLRERRIERSSGHWTCDPDYEYALCDGVIHINRAYGISVNEELSNSAIGDSPRRLEIGRRGLLQTLRWADSPLGSMEPHEVEVDVKAVGMNFRDILIAMGIVDSGGVDAGSFGCECAGVVCRIGSAVQDLEVGDRVIVVSGGTFCTRLRISAQLCTPIPQSLGFEEAATMPCVYATVIRSLIDLARLEKGQSVLIHSAAGGVGMAAIQVCKSIGAEIYATVGTAGKRQLLTEKFGIPPERIFNSRDTSFLDDVNAATNNRGVDVVLNSLSGELLHASWKCVAEFGIMVEIGKRDLLGHGKLDLNQFLANRTYCGMDLSQVCVDRPAVIRRLLGSIVEMFEASQIQPISPITCFDAANIEHAFRFMQKGQHVGKVVIRMPEDPAALASKAARDRLQLRSDVAYLLVGGLGGLGQPIATWMVECGARHLIFMSRSAGNTEQYQDFFDELQAMGCSVQAVSGNVISRADVQRAVNSAAKPIAGVLQMSMVLQDNSFEKITIEEWDTVLNPKVKGTWNLHETLGSELDFFVFFSSFSGIVGRVGQATYAAANTFLDAFVQYRHGLGLAASVLDIGCMSDVGYVSQTPGVLEIFRTRGEHMLRERDLLESLELVIKQSKPATNKLPVLGSSMAGYMNASQLAIGIRSTRPISDPNNRTVWKHDARFAMQSNYHSATAANESSGSDDLQRFLSVIASDPARLDQLDSVDLLARVIGQRVYGFMMQPEKEVDVSQTLEGVGVDSLIAIEIRNWWRQTLGIDITVLEMLHGGSMTQLGELAVQRLKMKYSNST